MLHILELFIHSLHNALNLSKLYNRVGSAYFTDVHISVTDDFKSEKESFFFIIIIQIYLLECKLQATTSIHSKPEIRKQKYFITQNYTNFNKMFSQNIDLSKSYTFLCYESKMWSWLECECEIHTNRCKPLFTWSYINMYKWTVSVPFHVIHMAGADPGGGPRGPGPPPDPRFWGPKIEHFWALFNFSIIFFCLASLGILFL